MSNKSEPLLSSDQLTNIRGQAEVAPVDNFFASITLELLHDLEYYRDKDGGE